MRPLNRTLTLVLISSAITVFGQTPAGLTEAKRIDTKTEQLNDLPDNMRAKSIADLAHQIGDQPGRYAVPLASNLAIDGTEASSLQTLQIIARTLAEALRKSPVRDNSHEESFEALASLDRYAHTNVSLNDPRYLNAMAKLAANDRQRSESDFTLFDLQGVEWRLKSITNKIVMVNFWATWCPPCQREIPDLERIYRRFDRNDLLILAITNEDSSTVRRFLAKHMVTYPILLDPGGKTTKQFLVNGIPQSLIFDRRGKLVAQSIARPDLQNFLAMLKATGLE